MNSIHQNLDVKQISSNTTKTNKTVQYFKLTHVQKTFLSHVNSHI